MFKNIIQDYFLVLFCPSWKHPYVLVTSLTLIWMFLITLIKTTFICRWCQNVKIRLLNGIEWNALQKSQHIMSTQLHLWDRSKSFQGLCLLLDSQLLALVKGKNRDSFSLQWLKSTKGLTCLSQKADILLHNCIYGMFIFLGL